MAYEQGLVSDSVYGMRALAESHAAVEAEKAKNRAAAQEIASSAYEMWSGSQNLKAEEFLTNYGDAVQYSQEYLDANPIKRMFTTGSGRLEVIPGEDATGEIGAALEGPKNLMGEIGEVGKEAWDFTKGTYKGLTEGQSLKDITKGAKSLVSKGTQKGGQKVAEKTAEKAGTNFGKAAGTLGTLYSAYDLGANWDEKSDAEQVSGAVATTLGIASLFMPSLAPWAAAASGVDMGVNILG